MEKLDGELIMCRWGGDNVCMKDHKHSFLFH